MKTTTTYWNALVPGAGPRWTAPEGLEGIAEEITLAVDEHTGDYTRLTRFLPGADTTPFGSRVHDYPEEIIVLEGSLYDAAVDRWLRTGDYASRPPGEVHGPFRSEDGCTVLEVSFPSQRAGI